MQTNFLLGHISVTPEALVVLKRIPLDLVARHAVNEHGLITPRQRKINERSMKTIGPIVSRYRADPTDPRTKYVLVETSESWGATLISIE